MRRLALWFLMSALFLSVGLQWACLQSAAWVGMVVSYSRQVNLGTAIAMTFDGEHPCNICKAVKKGQENQTGKNTKPAIQKFYLMVTKVDRIFFEHGSMKVAGGLVLVSSNPHSRPPTPPPRVG
ncbi:MAG: hypothetical protein RL693_1817 [Verrucomicrobiota bacterium]|jgi:hypothetical protein